MESNDWHASSLGRDVCHACPRHPGEGRGLVIVITDYRKNARFLNIGFTSAVMLLFNRHKFSRFNGYYLAAWVGGMTGPLFRPRLGGEIHEEPFYRNGEEG